MAHLTSPIQLHSNHILLLLLAILAFRYLGWHQLHPLHDINACRILLERCHVSLQHPKRSPPGNSAKPSKFCSRHREPIRAHVVLEIACPEEDLPTFGMRQLSCRTLEEKNPLSPQGQYSIPHYDILSAYQCSGDATLWDVRYAI
jgi:hypothetical protein